MGTARTLATDWEVRETCTAMPEAVPVAGALSGVTVAMVVGLD
jgi:hypothetical protein